MSDPTLFQYCQKIVVFRNDDTEVLLACRNGEADYNETYSFIGGKMESTDEDMLAGLKREKDEEVGAKVQLKIVPYISHNLQFIKKNGQHMILPHHYARYLSGEIVLNDEYSNFQWVKLSELAAFEPKIKDIPQAVQAVLRLKASFVESDFANI